jgi:hypothetical protein
VHCRDLRELVLRNEVLSCVNLKLDYLVFVSLDQEQFILLVDHFLKHLVVYSVFLHHAIKFFHGWDNILPQIYQILILRHRLNQR